MSFIKKYSVLLIPVGIALAAGVVIVLTILTSRSLARDIAKNSLGPADDIARLLDKPISERQPEVEKEIQDQRAQDVKGVVNLSRQCSMRELISYRIFLEKRDSSQQVFDEYGENYRAAVESLVRNMRALEAPGDMEVQEALNEGSQQAAARPGGYGDMGNYNPRVTRSPTSRNRNDNTRNAMVDAICGKRAEEILVYANPNLFKWYEYWSDFQFAGAEPAIQDCWYSQLAYWIYEDVVTTINNLNAGSQNVYSSPAKRLLGVSFREAVDYPKKTTGRIGYGSASGMRSYGGGVYDGNMSSRGDAPEYIRYPEGGVLDVETWMGRICNDDIDVVHFSVGVIVSSSAVMPFMKELCSAKEHTYRKDYLENGAQQTFQHNQIGILRSDVIAVERDAPDNANYRYGDEAVVRLDLICEYIFNRSGYDKIKPESIKVRLGQSEAAEGAPGAPGAPGRAVPPGRAPVRRAPAAAPTGRRGRSMPDVDI